MSIINVSTATFAAILRRKILRATTKTVIRLFIGNPKRPKNLSFAKKR